jgi:pyruvate-formate lyase-activating enzyme
MSVTGPYVKHRSFQNFSAGGESGDSSMLRQTTRALALLAASRENWPEAWISPLTAVSADLQAEGGFSLSPFIAAEMAALDDADLPRYLYHRYRYDVWPREKILDDAPPYLQIEPVSYCNYRCVFCYQVDRQYFRKSASSMGVIDPGLFREILEEATGKVEFLSLASRGEPLLHPRFDELMAATTGRFLALKINTNAAVLDEGKARAILDSGVGTLVFSADAASPELYKKLRVGGDLSRVQRNIERFQEIKAREYPHSRLITRVSGVRVNDEQSMDSMQSFWGSMVDQVAFVAYNPWENIYAAPENNLLEPCSDLWRRMFVWWDGVVNPCDSDYKSSLSVGRWGGKLKDMWLASPYQELRAAHVAGRRCSAAPCNRCTVV